MKKGLSEVIFILDMTGSMQSLAAETVIGYNNFIEKQKEIPGEANFTLVVFNSNETKTVHDCISIKDVSVLEQKDYRPDGMTPLFDTIGNTIKSIAEKVGKTPKKEAPENVIVAVMTDGEENFSHHYNRKAVFDMITEQKNAHKWEFIFLGANQDSYAEAGRIGIDAKDTFDYKATPLGTRSAYTNLSASIASYRK